MLAHNRGLFRCLPYYSSSNATFRTLSSTHNYPSSIVPTAFLIPTAICQGGGMAELKAITGDEPYRGLGENPPQPIPQPMGFWGRPRYSPVGYYGSGGLYGSPFGYGGLSRFTSVGHSPYGL
ncbi:hypothetical protein Q1695_007849 [Nippostrongylus brasiliensis]|nr:hypothetical protein Q1695_007849 [Nippostrongylus brasiliensis]